MQSGVAGTGALAGSSEPPARVAQRKDDSRVGLVLLAERKGSVTRMKDGARSAGTLEQATVSYEGSDIRSGEWHLAVPQMEGQCGSTFPGH